MTAKTFALLAATFGVALPILAAGVAPAAAETAAAACKAYAEAPVLAAQVKAGTLPAVAARLPATPMVVPADEIGVYGGTLRDLYTGSRLADYRHYGYEPLVRFSPDGSEVIPNVAAGWDIENNGATYVFHLRKGMKWSDGKPFTAKDILFWWQRIETNRKVTPGGARDIFIVDGEIAKVDAPDEYTVRFAWSKPNGNFLLDLASPYGQRVVQYPAHYVERFDIDLHPDEVGKMMAEAGEKNYAKWWKGRVGNYGDRSEQNDPKRPTILAWMTTEPYMDKQHFVLVRNPYYFKVDSACNQLPYIDNRDYTLVSEPEVQLLKTMAGEFDYSLPNISVPQNKGVFFENQKRGDYRFVEANSCDYNTMYIELPFNSPDKNKAKFYQNKDVRIALSTAIDRRGIIDTVYLGQGEPFQSAPRQNSPYYNERLAKQYTAFDAAKANAILDKYYPKKDAEGFRLYEDGSRISLNLIAQLSFRPEWSDILQIIGQNWADIGIRLTADASADEVYETRRKARDRDMQVWVGENGCGQLPEIGLYRLMRYQGNWDNWINWIDKNIKPQVEKVDGAEPIEPPAEIKRLYEITAALPVKIGAERKALMDEFMNTMADAFLNIGTVLPAGNYRIVSNRIGNVHAPLIEGWLYPGPAPSNFETFYIKAKK